MPTVNTSDIQARYNEQLARLYYLVEYSPDDVLSYVLSGVDLSDINIIVSADVDSLPNLQYGNPNLSDTTGMVYFVQSLGIIVISSNGKWLTLDGVTVRTDTVFGIAWAWGNGNNGRLGDNSVTDKSSPVSVVGGFTDWCQISAGGCQSLAIRKNGTAWGWGCNGQGRLGDNTTVNKSSPVSVIGGFTDWCQVSSGLIHSLGVRQNGTAWAWGAGAQGRLGDNTIADKSSPVSVVGGFTNWCQISAGAYHSLAVRTNGTAWAWGFGTCGRLGDDTVAAKSSPISVVGGFTDWCQISAGGCQSLAIRTNGTAWAWGFNNCGQIGNNTTTNRSSPVSVVGGFTDWCQISAGQLHSVAVRQNGTAWAWGEGSRGQLGNDCGVGDRSSPVSVVGGFTDWCQVSAAATPATGTTRSSLGLRQNGTAWGWGCNNCGQLGDSTTVDKSSPVSVVGGFTDWCQVSAGAEHSLGVITTS